MNPNATKKTVSVAHEKANNPSLETILLSLGVIHFCDLRAIKLQATSIQSAATLSISHFKYGIVYQIRALRIMASNVAPGIPSSNKFVAFDLSCAAICFQVFLSLTQNSSNSVYPYFAARCQ